MKPYYQDELVTLYQGDYRDYLDVLADLSIDAIVTDPPYGETSLDWDRWVEHWLVDAADLTSNLWCFGSFRMFMEHSADFYRSFKLAQDVVWEKHNGSGFATDRFKRVHEFATQWYRGDWGDLYNVPPVVSGPPGVTQRRKARPPHMGIIGDGTAYLSEDNGDRMMRSVVKLRSMHGKAINETEKPVPLVSLYVECSVPPGGLVVDLFAGSGSTGLAARQKGRRAVLFEKRPDQAAATARRLERETAQPFDFEGIA